MSTTKAKRQAPRERSRNDDPQPFRVWANSPGFVQDTHPWKCIGAFFYLTDACSFAKALAADGCSCVLQTPAELAVFSSDPQVVEAMSRWFATQSLGS